MYIYMENIINYNYEPKHYRAVILILASNNNKIYKNCRKIWKLYMNLDPLIKVFFVYGNITNKNDELNDFNPLNDIYLNNINEDRFPYCINKTIEALKIIKMSGITYDFLVRTNISTFWDFNKLKEHLNCLPTTNCYSGNGPLLHYTGVYYLSGTDTIVTPEMIDAFLENENLIDQGVYEDTSMGIFFNGILKVPFLQSRICFFEDIISIDEINKINKRINTAILENIDHYRVKTMNDNREKIDYFIYMQLLDKIYGIKLTDYNYDK